MAKVAVIQQNFNAGEFSPLMYGRTDLDKYQGALATCLNTIPQVQGGWTRRPGTRFVAESKDSTKPVRMQRFEFSVTQAYMIEFGHLYMRFYRDRAPVLEATKTISGATRASPVVITATSHGYSNGDDVELASIGGMTELNGRRVRVANVTTHTFEITDLQGNAINGTAFTAYTTGGTAARVYTVVTTYDEDDLFQLKFVQYEDVMWITHRAYPPRKLTRSAHTSWTWSGIDFLHGPFLDANTTATTLTPSATTGAGITITASSTTGINGGAGFQTTDAATRLVRILHGSTWGWAKIVGWTSTTVVTADVISNFGATTASANWRLGLWSDYAGWPACATFYDGRLAYAGSPALPQRIAFSVPGQYDIFRPTAADGTVTDANAIDVDLSSNDAQAIRWMHPDEKGLVVGAVNGEFIVRASTPGDAITPTNRKASQSTDNGSADVQAVRAGKAIIMLDRTGRSVHEVAYVYTDDGFRAPEMTTLAEHITKGGLSQLAYQKHPQPVIWAPRADGALVGMTYSREQNVVGWHRHELGGVTDTGGPIAALVESVACIPAPDLKSHDVWVAVRRRIGGVTKRWIEVMTAPYERGDTLGTGVYLDAAFVRDSDSASANMSALWHLVGETVSVQYDGRRMADQVVPASGIITLPAQAFTCVIGFPYNSDGKTLRNNAGAANGTAQGKTQRTHRATFRLHETGELWWGNSFDNLEQALLRSTDDDTNEGLLFSGDYTRPFPGDYTRDNTICWRASGPFPATVLAVMPQQDTQDR